VLPVDPKLYVGGADVPNMEHPFRFLAALCVEVFPVDVGSGCGI
jgi:hypothetical protein